MSSPSDAIAVGSPKISWERDGSSHGEKVVFIHALGCNLDLWDAIVPLIPAGFQSIRYDLSGHGRSAAGPHEFSIEDHARDLIQVLDECGAEDANLVSVSVGGMIALAAALMEPSRIRSLVLCATAGRSGSVENWSERIAMARGQGLNALADGILMRWFVPGFAERKPGVLRQARMAREHAGEWLCRLLRGVARHGSAAAALRHSLPGAGVVRGRGCGHAAATGLLLPLAA
jgi:pimeloyl-ACP methyl ester carboxylesterase